MGPLLIFLMLPILGAGELSFKHFYQNITFVPIVFLAFFIDIFDVSDPISP